jgi:hypothetical protein
LLEKLDSISDAVEPGGSGDPFAGLTFSEREVLMWLYRSGYPRGAEPQMRRELVWGFGIEVIRDQDPGYFHDFWSETGYAGADRAATIANRLVEVKATVTRTFGPEEVGDSLAKMLANTSHATLAISVDCEDPQRLFWCKATITTGKAAGRSLYIAGVDGDVLTPYPVGYPELFNGVDIGDEIVFDNRDFVAFAHYWLHTGESKEHPELGVDGRSIWPVRPHLATDESSRLAASMQLTGKFSGKMIFCNAALDVHVFVPTAYPRLVREHLGDATEEHFRHWWIENSSHSPPAFQRVGQTDWLTRLVDYTGYIDQALRDIVAWVEDDVAPPHQQWEITRDNALVLPPTAEARGGIQPIARVTVNGNVRADVRVGEKVTLRGEAAVPPGNGTVVLAEWDFDQTATWPIQHEEVDGSSETIEVSVTHAYDRPGTYFPCFRVGSHRLGRLGAGPPVYNIARARVVVSD